MNVTLGLDLNPLDVFGTDKGAVAAAANAWNSNAGITQDQAAAFIDAYHSAIISGRITPPAPTDGQGGSWDSTTTAWMNSIAASIPATMAQTMAMMTGLWASARAGKVGREVWAPTANVFEAIGKTVSNVTGSVAKSADSKLNIIIFGALGLGALYLYLNKRK